MQWERISEHEYRAKTIGGWLIKTVYYNFDDRDRHRGRLPEVAGVAMVFVPDPKYQWGRMETLAYPDPVKWTI